MMYFKIVQLLLLASVGVQSTIIIVEDAKGKIWEAYGYINEVCIFSNEFRSILRYITEY